jgi:hypothetical protein
VRERLRAPHRASAFGKCFRTAGAWTTALAEPHRAAESTSLKRTTTPQHASPSRPDPARSRSPRACCSDANALKTTSAGRYPQRGRAILEERGALTLLVTTDLEVLAALRPSHATAPTSQLPTSRKPPPPVRALTMSTPWLCPLDSATHTARAEVRRVGSFLHPRALLRGEEGGSKRPKR